MKSTIKTIALIVSASLISGSALAEIPFDQSFKLNPDNSSIFENKKIMLQDGGASFDEETQVLSIGIGFGGGNYYASGRGAGHSYGRSPLFSLSYETALKTKLGPGYVGVGPYLSYQNAHNRYDNMYYNGNNYYYKHNWNYFTVAGKGAYHLDFLNWPMAEIYAGPILGVRINSYTYTSNSPDPEADYYKLNEKSVNPVACLFIGARWNFSNHTGLFAEAGSGYGISFATFGVHFRF
jgi:hypothetical protein